MPPNFKAVPLRSEKKSAQKMFLRKRFAKVQLTLVAILGFLGVGQAVAQDGFRVPAVSTNLIDWALVTPNVGVDIPLTNPIYINGASLYVEAKMSLNANKAYAPDMNYEYFSGKIEYRRHFRFGENSNECSLMTNAWNGLARLFTTKKYWIERVNDRLNDKGRSYAGIFAQYADFSMCLPLYNYEHGRVGRAAIAGFSYGFNKPFYNFSNKYCLEWEFGTSLGCVLSQYDCYNRVESEVTGSGKWYYPIITDLHVSLVLRRQSISKMYRKTRVTDY